MTDEQVHRAAVVRAIEAARAHGKSGFHQILQSVEGADPGLVAECLGDAKGTSSALPLLTAVASQELLIRLPAPDPARSQWWFTGETVLEVANRATFAAHGGRVLCLGTPTIAHELISSGVDVLLLDCDFHVVKAVRHLSDKPVALEYDVADALPPGCEAAYAAAVIDPPWYEDVFRAFLGRALCALEENGDLFCTLPPRLTRPGIESFRRILISEIIACGCEILGLEVGRLAYVVPRFEEVAFSRITDFRSIPWRHADLLHVRKLSGAKAFSIPDLQTAKVEVFARRAHEFRVFLRGSQSLDPRVALEPLPTYSGNVSTRAYAGESPDLWTTEKRGVRLGQVATVRDVLRVWQDVSICSATEAIDKLSESVDPAVAKNIVNAIDGEIDLWTKFAAVPALRTDEEIETAKKHSLSDWATAASSREHPDPSDMFRGRYQRDRDRVLWSQGLRRLAHKTQLFPTEHDDQLRQRLAHSIEVMQLASTIGASFGLDRDLIEAGALAHDIGHTPFGHAGEHALNRIFNEIDTKLGGFNHYEHGVDVVRWLESPYAVSRMTAFCGLNLTPEVAECILKHTYCQTGNALSSESIYRNSKHSSFVPAGYCHLEGQAVRLADKISYFVSDLEDGNALAKRKGISLSTLPICRGVIFIVLLRTRANRVEKDGTGKRDDRPPSG
ncbi:MAG: HD domain-containing protein [Terracidiphilus sp.]